MRRLSWLTMWLVIAAGSADNAAGQERRSAASTGDATARPVIAPNPRFPFAGSWVGTMKLPEDVLPMMVELDVTNGRYDGATIWPDNGRVPYRKVELRGEELTWQLPNSGGGTWHYTARKPVGDTLRAVVELKDAPDIGPVSGTLMLVRKPSPKSR